MAKVYVGRTERWPVYYVDRDISWVDESETVEIPDAQLAELEKVLKIYDQWQSFLLTYLNKEEDK